MFTLHKSALFMQQWQTYAQAYKDRAGMEVAERFIVAVIEALDFIRQNPYACPLYDVGDGYDDLQPYAFRKWNLHSFPHVVLFRVRDATLWVEVMYAHKMDIASRLTTDAALP